MGQSHREVLGLVVLRGRLRLDGRGLGTRRDALGPLGQERERWAPSEGSERVRRCGMCSLGHLFGPGPTSI